MMVTKTSAERVTGDIRDVTHLAMPDTNHRTLVRFEDKFDENYRRLKDRILEQSNDIQNKGRKRFEHRKSQSHSNAPVATGQRTQFRPSVKVMVPMMRNDDFTGRQAELQMLHGQLNSTRQDGHTQPGIVAIRGLGGVGKTQVALEYLFRHETAYDRSFWIRAQDATIIQQDFANIGEILNTETPTSDLGSAVQRVKTWLSTTCNYTFWCLLFQLNH